MTKGMIFWMLMILWFVCMLGAFLHWSPLFSIGGDVLAFVLFGLLGWQVFGAAIK